MLKRAAKGRPLTELSIRLREIEKGAWYGVLVDINALKSNRILDSVMCKSPEAALQKIRSKVKKIKGRT